MRSIRMTVVGSFAAIALTACGPFGNDDSSSANSNTPSASTSKSPAAIAVPALPKGKINAQGDLCKLIPTDKASEVLGKQVTSQPWMSKLGPDFVDACNFTSFDDKGTSTTDDDTSFVLNVFVRTGAETLAKAARQLAANSDFEVHEHHIAGYDEAFYANREGNIRKGDMLYAANGSVGEQDEARTMAFITMVANTVG